MASQDVEFYGPAVNGVAPLVATETHEVPDPAPVVDPVVSAAEAIEREVSARLDSSANSIAKMRAAINDGLAAAVASLRGGQ